MFLIWSIISNPEGNIVFLICRHALSTSFVPDFMVGSMDLGTWSLVCRQTFNSLYLYKRSALQEKKIRWPSYMFLPWNVSGILFLRPLTSPISLWDSLVHCLHGPVQTLPSVQVGTQYLGGFYFLVGWGHMISSGQWERIRVMWVTGGGFEC